MDKNLIYAYKNYRKTIMSYWETYIFDKLMVVEMEKLIRNDIIKCFTLESLSNPWNNGNTIRHFLKKDMLGITQRNSSRLQYRRTIIEAVATTEIFFQKICEIVYKDFPGRIKNNNSDENNIYREKLFDIIINCNTRDEILDKISEEKIRSIFYGNPIDFFIKDKGNIGLEDYFSKNHNLAIEKYKEIIARRNIIIHNNGKVDSKYLREIKNSGYRLGQIPNTNEMYLREMIFILRGLSATTTKIVLENIYKFNCNAPLLNTVNFFKKVFP